MKRTVKKIECNQTIIVEEFNNFNELLNISDSRETNFGRSGGARTDNDNDWRGSSWEEAINMLRYGWQDKESVNLFNDKVAKLEKMQDVQKMAFKNDIVGFAPIVPLAIKGVPQCMVNSTRKPKKAKVISLVIDVTVSCGTSVKEILEWGAKVVAKIMNLEKQGFRVRIYCAATYTRDEWSSKAHAMKVLIKSENQPFDIQRMMFPIAHSAFFRRISFDWYERLPEAQELSGYGSSIYHHGKRHADAIKRAIADTENSYYICNKEDINEILKEVS